MDIRIFAGGLPEQNRSSDQIAEIVSTLRNAPYGDPVYILHTFRFANCEIGCLVLTQKGPIILDLQHVRGEIIGGERGPWKAVLSEKNEVTLTGNVFLRAKKHRWDFFKKMQAISRRHFPHIKERDLLKMKSWAYFGQGSHFDDAQVAPRARAWFDVISAEKLVRKVRYASSGYTLRLRDMDAIVRELHLKEQSPADYGSADMPQASRNGQKLSGLSKDSVFSRAEVLELLDARTDAFEGFFDDADREIPPGPQSIRGVAGSGKTELLCQKAAYMHWKYPEWTIGVIFNTPSLDRVIQDRIQRYIDMLGGRWDPEHLQILHARGGEGSPGLYRMLCDRHSIQPRTCRDLKRAGIGSCTPHELLAYVCRDLLDRVEVLPLFDALLIDEGQDLITDRSELLYDGKQPFFLMAYSAVRPVHPEHPDVRRIVWAYDEYQNTNTRSIPSSRELFGGDPQKCLSPGLYAEGIRRNIVIRTCYRTSGQVLSAAHAAGMGLLFKGGMLDGPTTRAGWNTLGYEVSGAFRPGNEIRLSRPADFSYNIAPMAWKGPLISLEIFPSRDDELAYVADAINRIMRTDHIGHILVISMSSEAQFVGNVARCLSDTGISTHIPSASAPNVFWNGGAVTVTTADRAKGHEADMVYVVGLDFVAKNDEDIRMRRRLLVAMTRTRAWVTLTGIKHYLFYRELEKIMRSNGDLAFIHRGKTRPLHSNRKAGPEATVSYQQELNP